MFQLFQQKLGLSEFPSGFNWVIDHTPVALPFGSIWTLKAAKHTKTREEASVFFVAKDPKLGSSKGAKHCESRLKKLRMCPNILKLLDSCEVDSGLYLITEKVTPLVAVPRMPNVWGIVEVIDALHFMHEKARVVHGSLGPHALYLNQASELRVFGLEACGDLETTTLSEIQGIHQGIGHQFWDVNLTYNMKLSPLAWDLVCLKSVVAYFGSQAQSVLSHAFPKPLKHVLQALDAPQNSLTLLLEAPFFREDDSVKALRFLQNYWVEEEYRRTQFFERFPLLKLPGGLLKTQILSKILEVLDFKPTGPVVLSALKALPHLNQEEYDHKLKNRVTKLFGLSDRSIRFFLLEAMSDLLRFLDVESLNVMVPKILVGCQDTSVHIVESTLKALKVMGPQLGPYILRVCHALQKVQGTPGLRVGVAQTLGGLAANTMGKPEAQGVFQGLGRLLGDPEVPVRLAALKVVDQCVKTQSLELVVEGLGPLLCKRVLDPSPSVANQSIGLWQEILRGCTDFVKENRTETEGPPQELETPEPLAAMAKPSPFAPQISQSHKTSDAPQNSHYSAPPQKSKLILQKSVKMDLDDFFEEDESVPEDGDQGFWNQF